jgi:hypothetical protein
LQTINPDTIDTLLFTIIQFRIYPPNSYLMSFLAHSLRDITGKTPDAPMQVGRIFVTDV